MRNILLFILVLFCWTTALAQDEAVPGDAPAGGGETAEELQAAPSGAGSSLEFEDYTAEGFGITIPVPTNGELQIPGGYGWSQEPEVAFVWRGDPGSPVAMIEMRADDIGTEITREQYDHFYDALVSEWEGQPDLFTVLRSRSEPYRFGEMDWLIIEVEDSSAAPANNTANPKIQGMFKGDDGKTSADDANTSSRKVYYTIFTTFHNEVFYTIGFYYLRPVSEAVQELAVPMLRGFSVAAE